MEIYGPPGTRLYLRIALKTTHTILAGSYTVHELHFSDPPDTSEEQHISPHRCEQVGRDISQSPDGTWPTICETAEVKVHAAPILHSVPCVGFVVHEKPIPGKIDRRFYMPHLERNKSALMEMGVKNVNLKLGDLQKGHTVHLPDGTVLDPPVPRLGFKIVILGDTYDPAGIADLAQDANILIHEATNAFLSGLQDEKEDDTAETVEARARSHGHSTPQMAGAFANRIGTKKLILNHFSARYAGDDDVNPDSARVMDAIANLAMEQFGTGREVICARDLMRVDVRRDE